MAENERTWGIWGGTSPGGWCTFQVSREGELGYSHVGTREEAEVGRRGFLAEAGKYGRLETTTYEVVEFDLLREPPAILGKPTPAQRRFLERVLAGEDFNRIAQDTPQWSKISEVLVRNGWIFNRKDKVVVTRAGHQILQGSTDEQGTR